MKETASSIVTSLQEINSGLGTCITNIKQCVADLNVFGVFTPDEKKRVEDPNTISIEGCAEKYALVQMGWV